MLPAQTSVFEIIALFRRRRKYFIIPVLVITFLCTVGAFLLPRKYVSSTTILVQRDDILNPLVSFDIAVTLATVDRLGTFYEIVYSTRIIDSLINHLMIGTEVKTEADHQRLIKNVKKNIEVDRHGSESFSISYIDTDPNRAQIAATFLAGLFIQTKLNVENERNQRAVEFFEKKLEEFRLKFEAAQNTLVTEMRSRSGELPSEDVSLYTRMDHLDKEISAIDAKIKDYQEALNVLRSYAKVQTIANNKQPVFDLQRSDLPYVAELRTSLTKYDDFASRYTAKYPEVEKLDAQIIGLLGRMRIACDSEITKDQGRRWDLEKDRQVLVDKIKQTSISHKIDKDKDASYDIYKQLYDDMKLKLEQARTTRDLGSRGASQFTVLEPAIVPSEPSKPNRLLMIMGGFALGFVLGLVSVLITELLDTTVWTAKDIEIFDKPVVALIPEGFPHHRK